MFRTIVSLSFRTLEFRDDFPFADVPDWRRGEHEQASCSSILETDPDFGAVQAEDAKAIDDDKLCVWVGREAREREREKQAVGAGFNRVNKQLQPQP